MNREPKDELGKSGKRRSRRKTHYKKKSSFGAVMEPFLNVFLILLFLIIIALIAGAAFATNYMIGVLQDISVTDYSEPQNRIKEYQAYFERLATHGYGVVESEAFIREGEKYYLWTVTPPKSSEQLVYRWKLSLEDNKVVPLTSAAIKLDQELGFATGLAFE